MTATAKRSKDHFPRAPQHIIDRLQQQERRQRLETRRRGLPCEPINVEGLLLLARNLCTCGCARPLDFESEWNAKHPPPMYPIIAHVFARGAKGGSHTRGVVEIWGHACNAKAAPQEWSDIAKGRRMAVNWSAKDAPEEPRERNGASLVSRSTWQKTEGPSSLSKDHPRYVKRGFGK